MIEVKYRLDKQHLDFFTAKKDEGLDKGLSRLAIFKKYEAGTIGKKKIITMFATLGIHKKTLDAFRKSNLIVLRRKAGNILIEYPKSPPLAGTQKASIYAKKECKTCGKQFTPKSHNHFYCKPKCRKG